ncbi:MAG TPA: polysaccharide biosynthesis tyrosine autokinase [Candidatus Wunengus sp. YC60]|uniref:polysaccharide biosynthesis tyrosine autokinase n=1 Tax=Candidatus Wunengus sp. YC60 TaxID=3367697 RepID=UPI0040288F28
MKSNLVESTLRDYVAVIFRRKMVIIVTFITVLISVAVGLELKTPIYVAQVKMLVSGKKQTTSPYYKDIGFYGQSQVSVTQSEIVNSNPVIERAVRVLGLHERPFDYEKDFCSPIKAWLIKLRNKMQSRSHILPEQEQEYIFRTAVENLKECIKIETIRDTDLFTISARDFSPEAAAMIANAVSRSYVIFDLEQQVAELETQYGEKHQDVLLLKDTIATMVKQLSGLPLSSTEAIGPASVKIIEQAQVPFMPTGTRKSLTLVLAFFMSIFLGIMLAFGFEYIDQTFKSPQEVETFLELPLLGAIPKNGFKNKSLLRDAKQATVSNPSYHDLSDQMYLLMKDKKLKALLITAVSHLEGSTTIVANLSLSLAREGHKVLVIDANLKSPEIHEIFNIPNNSGLTHVLEGKFALEEAIKEVDGNLSVLTAGNTPLNPTLLFDSTRMANIIKAAKEKYGMVFVDYASLRHSHDANILSSYLDGTVLVVNEGKTKRPVIKALIAPLVQKKANLIGVILNNRTFVIPRILYKWV